MADTNKKYGLFLPKNKKSAVKTTNIFDDDSDDDLPGMVQVNATINKEAQKSKVKRQTQIAIDQALEQDPNIYEYDNIYDSMTNTKAESEAAAKAKKDNKPKYIANLMKAAEKRKRDQEKVQEKKIQKERETEGGQFEDKEVFVTGKYREKLQEMEKEAERERREAAMEEMLDVKKQKDMSGFYRYLLNEKTGESIHNGEQPEPIVKTESDTEVNTSRVKTELESPERSAPTSSRVKRDSSSDSSDDSSEADQTKRRYDKGRNSYSRSPQRRKRSRSSDRRKRSRSRDRRRSRSRDRRRSRSPNRSHRERDINRSSDSKHRHSRRSRSNERYSHKDKKRRSSSREKTSKSSKRSRSRSKDRSTKSKDHMQGSNDRASKQLEEKLVPLVPSEKKTEEISGKLETASKDSDVKSKYARHTTDKTLNDAKARYLARQLAKEKAKLAASSTGDN